MMVFGLFEKGDMVIEHNRSVFAPGEVIEGKVKLKLKKPVKARELNIRLFGEEETHTTNEEGRTETHKNTIYEQFEKLDGEKEYPAGEELVYDFQIPIPATLLDEDRPPEGLLGTIATTLSYMQGRRGMITWKLHARLDVPWGTDVGEYADIIINKP